MYPKLSKENKIGGLEMIDLLLLIMVYLAVFLFSKNLFFNFGILFGAYLFLAFYKKRKAPRYTQNLIRFLIHPSRYTQSQEVSR